MPITITKRTVIAALRKEAAESGLPSEYVNHALKQIKKNAVAQLYAVLDTNSAQPRLWLRCNCVNLRLPCVDGFSPARDYKAIVKVLGLKLNVKDETAEELKLYRLFCAVQRKAKQLCARLTFGDGSGVKVEPWISALHRPGARLVFDKGQTYRIFERDDGEYQAWCEDTEDSLDRHATLSDAVKAIKTYANQRIEHARDRLNDALYVAGRLAFLTVKPEKKAKP